MAARWTWVCAAVLVPAATAAAHPDVDAGRSRYAEADLSGALEAFARAEASDDLTREELASMLETRILVHLALGDRDAAEQDVARLVAFAPHHRFSAEVPPDVVQRFEQIRADSPGPIDVAADGVREGDDVVIRTRVRHDPLGMVREVRLHYRTDGGAYQTVASEVTVPGDASVEYWAEAVGPGGAVLATMASASAPRRLDAGGYEAGGAAEAGSGIPTWAWIGGGALAAGIVVALVVAASGGEPSDQTQPRYPMVEF